MTRTEQVTRHSASCGHVVKPEDCLAIEQTLENARTLLRACLAALNQVPSQKLYNKFESTEDLAGAVEVFIDSTEVS